jgi:hypothetical protein
MTKNMQTPITRPAPSQRDKGDVLCWYIHTAIGKLSTRAKERKANSHSKSNGKLAQHIQLMPRHLALNSHHHPTFSESSFIISTKMRPRAVSLVSLLLMEASLPLSTSFVTQSRRHFQKGTALNARYMPPVPPPPPPPPPPIDNGIHLLTEDFYNKGLNSVYGVSERLQLSLDRLPDLNLRLPRAITNLDIRQQLETFATDWQGQLATTRPVLDQLLFHIKFQVSLLGANMSTAELVLSALFAYTIMRALLNSFGASPSVPYPSGTYDPLTAQAYFEKRPLQVVGRGLSILVQSLQFGASLLRDKINNQLEVNEFQRGKELAMLLTSLGPTFIKGTCVIACVLLSFVAACLIVLRLALMRIAQDLTLTCAFNSWTVSFHSD